MSGRNNFSSLVGHLSRGKNDGASGSKTSLFSSASATMPGRTLNPGSLNDVKALSLSSSSGLAQKGIKFGTAPTSKATSSGSSSEWANLLSKTASGGLSSAFGGNLMSAIGGIGGLVSSIVSLFGGSKQDPAPLIPFGLPASQAQTFAVNQNPGSTSTSGSATLGGIYGSAQYSSAPTVQSVHDQLYQYQSQQIAQSVKQALLNSSSLNDVIAEI